MRFNTFFYYLFLKNNLQKYYSQIFYFFFFQILNFPFKRFACHLLVKIYKKFEQFSFTIWLKIFIELYFIYYHKIYRCKTCDVLTDITKTALRLFLVIQKWTQKKTDVSLFSLSFFFFINLIWWRKPLYFIVKW